MPLLFAYGTLQREDVQMAAFGRSLQGKKDELAWFERSAVPVEDPAIAARLGTSQYENVMFNGHFDSRVDGTLYEVTDAELEAADRFEGESGYHRVTVTLASRKQAWIYVHAPAK